ncbi:hypothetical protein [Chryseobacterium sp.]|uniref:hypothetical protein n=1 Tax=Chryseobacterium sp. TaxID=1871047 RepID=UPI002624E049|nr:hypothetical protein [Chryseobacterium sp.]
MKTLLLFVRILRWSFGIVFLIISVGLLTEQNFIASLIMFVLGLFSIPFTCTFILTKVASIDIDGTNKLLKTIDYSNLQTILPIYEQNVINSPKPVSNQQKSKAGRRIYYKTLCKAVSDFHVTQSEILALNQIKLYFSLSDEQISSEKKKIAERTVSALIQKCYENNVLTDAENQQITTIAAFLQFPLPQTEAIKQKTAVLIFNKILDEKVSDSRLSPSKETQLVQTTRDLKIDHQNIKTFLSDKKIRKLERSKLLWNLDHGIFPVLYNPPITLIRDETGYLQFSATLIENKMVHAGYSRSSSSISFRITKGVNARVGGGRYRPVKEEVRKTYSGTLFLTSSRIIFNAGGKSFQIPFNKLISHEFQRGNLELVVQNKSYLLRLSKSEAEVLTTGLSSSIRQYGKVNDHIKVQAMKEISMNYNFISIS